MAALSMGLRPEVRRSHSGMALFIGAYNIGRIMSYAAAGALAGGMIGQVAGFFGPVGSQVWLQRIAAVFLILIGLHLAGWFDRLKLIERVGVPLWKRIEPFARQLMPIKSFWQALLYGVVWGWIPCGMVYTMLFAAAAQANWASSGLYMAFFGLGTLVPVAATGIFVGRIREIVQSGKVRMVLGSIIIIWGVVSLLYPDFAHHIGLGQDSASMEYCTGPSLE